MEPETSVRIPAARAEPRDIGEGFIWIAAAAMLVMIGGAGIATYWLYPSARPDHVAPVVAPVFPPPGLQLDAEADLRALRAREAERLTGRGWADPTHRVRRIPIDEAMREIAAEGIPQWPAGR